MSTIRAQLRDRRRALGAGLRETAGRAGISASYLCDAEYGRRSFPPETLERVALALDLDPEPLLWAWVTERLETTDAGKRLLNRVWLWETAYVTPRRLRSEQRAEPGRVRRG